MKIRREPFSLEEMKNKFPLIKSFDTVYIEKEYGLSFMPENI